MTLVESKGTPVVLTDGQAQALETLGRKLASKTGWWGDEEQESPPKSVIEVSREPGETWSITVREAVGIISVDELQLVISPKIPLTHFLYLAEQSGVIPRIEAQSVGVDPSTSLWEIIAHWFIHATEGVLRGELAKGYREATDELELARGRVLAFETAEAFYQGRPVISCEFEEFSEDIALNRLLLAGCDLVASSAALDRDTRHRARVALSRMTEVGALQHSDLRAQVDRLTYRYRSAIAFAKVLLKGSGIKIAHGAAHGWCFLIRTPELIEAGVRGVLKQHLGSYWRIEKRGRTIRGAGFSINPDLVFGESVAIGDVKYKLLASDWSRADLYQAVAFASGYESEHALVIGFNEGESAALPPAVTFGRIDVQAVAWDARLECDPEESGKRMSASVGGRLGKSTRPTKRAEV